MFGLRTFVKNGEKFFDDIILILYKANFFNQNSDSLLRLYLV